MTSTFGCSNAWTACPSGEFPSLLSALNGWRYQPKLSRISSALIRYHQLFIRVSLPKAESLPPPPSMLRRQIRQRREFLHSREVEQKEKQIWERKQRVKELLAKGKPVPRGEGLGEREAAMDAAQQDPEDNVDNEYSKAGIEDPKVVITTSRDPSSRLMQFTKEMTLCIPNSIRINRGAYVMSELANACRANGVTDLIVLHEHRGVPDSMVISHFPHGPTFYFTLSNVVLRHTLDDVNSTTVSQQYPHLIFEGFGSKLGQRVQDGLRFLYPVPRENSSRTEAFVNEGDYIHFRHHVHVKTSHKDVELAEVGPRMALKPYEIRQGTLEMEDADVEWALRPYHRTAKKRNYLGGN